MDSVPPIERKKVILSSGIINLDSLSSQVIYDILIDKKFSVPSSIGRGSKKFDMDSNEVIDYFKVVHKISLDMYSKQFQYKLVHNFLPANYLLYKWKLIDSFRCSYCFVNNETLEHLFGECFVTRNLYYEIREFMEKLSVQIPPFNAKNIMFGLHPCRENLLSNQIILTYKMVVYYNRNELECNMFFDFKRRLKYTQKMEYIIAKQKGKIHLHLAKWRSFCRN